MWNIIFGVFQLCEVEAPNMRNVQNLWKCVEFSEDAECVEHNEPPEWNYHFSILELVESVGVINQLYCTYRCAKFMKTNLNTGKK